jgi:hypothetical protein
VQVEKRRPATKTEMSSRRRNLLARKRKLPPGNGDAELQTELVSRDERPVAPETGLAGRTWRRSDGYGDRRPTIGDCRRDTTTAGWGMGCVQWTRALTGRFQPRAAGNAGFRARCPSALLYKETDDTESWESSWHARCVSRIYPASPFNHVVISRESDGPRGQTRARRNLVGRRL